MPKRSNTSTQFTPWKDAEEKPAMQRCEVSGCEQEGVHKAPKSRSALRDYQWLCLEHVRQFNKQWNYFDGMDGDSVMAFQKDAMTGHRPTWKMGDAGGYAESDLFDSAMRFRGGEGFESAQERREALIPRMQRKALAALDLTHPTTQKDIKKSYKTLVKKHHPDVNKQSKEAEELFKRITAAYDLLSKEYQEETL